MMNQSLLSYFLDANAVVKCVMLILLVASVASWTFIFQQGFFLKQAKKAADDFEDEFWSGIELSKLYSKLVASQETTEVYGLAAIFQAGFREFLRLRHLENFTSGMVASNVQRAMQIAYTQELDKLEQHLPFLATVGSISPYIGLFGTVWGIMTSFQALSASKQTATIAMVAPGISEALVATAMGLFASIPAVIFYNHYVNDVDRLLNRYNVFQEEFFNLLNRTQVVQHAES